MLKLGALSPVPTYALQTPARGTVIAFDFGEKRIGSAVGDLALRIAHPLTTVEAEDNRSRFAAIAKLIDEWRPVVLVVGVPVPSGPGEHEIARLARRFARRLEGRFGIRTDLIDERLSSHAAEASLREQGVRGRRMKNVVDAAAAQQILQSYFETLQVRVSSAAHRP
jgi:putative Holliday junction resolvase